MLPPAEIVGSEDKMEQLEQKAQVFFSLCCARLGKPFPVLSPL